MVFIFMRRVRLNFEKQCVKIWRTSKSEHLVWMCDLFKKQGIVEMERKICQSCNVCFVWGKKKQFQTWRMCLFSSPLFKWVTVSFSPLRKKGKRFPQTTVNQMVSWWPSNSQKGFQSKIRYPKFSFFYKLWKQVTLKYSGIVRNDCVGVSKQVCKVNNFQNSHFFF